MQPSIRSPEVASQPAELRLNEAVTETTNWSGRPGCFPCSRRSFSLAAFLCPLTFLTLDRASRPDLRSSSAASQRREGGRSTYLHTADYRRPSGQTPPTQVHSASKYQGLLHIRTSVNSNALKISNLKLHIFMNECEHQGGLCFPAMKSDPNIFRAPSERSCRSFERQWLDL